MPIPPRTIRIGCLIFAACLLGGCLQYTSQQSLGQQSEYRRYRIKHMAIIDGQTTRDAIHQALGLADYASDEWTELYTWEVMEQEHNLVDMAELEDFTRKESGVVRHFLLLRFDDQGVLKAHRRTHQKRDQPDRTLDRLLSEWAEEISTGK